MAAPIRVFVNERPLALPPGADVLAAVRAFDPELAADVARGAAYVTDGRGIEIGGAVPLAAGAILRAVRSARRAESRPLGDRDADA